MTKLLICAAALLLAAAPLAAQKPASSEEIARAVDSMATRVVASGLSPAIGVAVVKDGKTIFSRAYGWADVSAHIPVDDRTLWYLASTSKSYTGFGIALLAQQGALKLDDPITSLLPNVKWPDSVDAAHITLAQFLAHTHHINGDVVVQSAAFTGAFPEKYWPQLIQFTKPTGNQDLVYTNFGYNVAAMVIDRLRPEGWKRFLEHAVYLPAGLHETYTRLSGLDARRIAKPHRIDGNGQYVTMKFEKTDVTMNAAGGHVATLHDLARWITVQMDSGRIDGRQVFPREAVGLSHTMIARQTRASAMHFGPFDREGWAAGWDIGSYHGEPMVSRFGSYASIRSHISFLPARRIGVIAQVNGPVASAATDIIAAFVYDLDAGRTDARALAQQRLSALIDQLPAARRSFAASDSVRRSRQLPLSRPLSDFVGSYYSPQYGTLSFYMLNGALHYRWGVLDGPTEIYSAARNVMRIEIAGDGYTAAFDFGAGSGAASAVVLAGTRFERVAQ